jgi:predicted DNA binding CopG/RHH family protein
MAEEIDPLDRDLSDLLTKGSWQRVQFELKPKNKTVTIRMSEDLLDAVKEQAKKSGLDYQKFIRIALERLVHKN